VSSAPDEARLRREARRAWEAEVARAVLPSAPRRALTLLVGAVGGLTLAAVSWRVARLFEGWAMALVAGIGVIFAVALSLGPWWVRRRLLAEGAERLSRARGERRSASCPRCGAPVLARECSEAGERPCGRCGARLLEAEGLLVQHIAHPRWRRIRWRTAARLRLETRRPRAAIALSPTLWLGSTGVALGALWLVGAQLGGVVGLPARAMEAPLGLDRQIPHRQLAGRALARADTPEPPPGPVTRPRAPLWVGTQVLARQVGALHQLAVVVRADPPRAFVVFANGDADWVHRRDLLAPELASGDALEVSDGARVVPATLLARVGPALRVEIPGEGARWTDASCVWVRSDGAHRRGEGLESEVPPGAWVEAQVGPGAFRPGVAVDAREDPSSLLVATSDGSERWIPRVAADAQQLGPGARVWVDGVSEGAVIAARIGHALAVVSPDGTRSWTSLARVRRRAP